MSLDRFVIVNADDFGLSAGTNAGIVEAHERGIVTSASLMVRQPAAAAAAEYARKNSALSVGLHVDLGEWTMREGEWVQAYEVVPHEDAEAIAGEVARQLEEFRRLTGRDPTHLDSHQHIHRHEPVRSAVLAFAKSLRIPVRDFSPAITYCGDFYGQGKNCLPFPEGIGVENLINILAKLPAGMSELGCHPGCDTALDSSYRDERLIEVRTLCDPRVRASIVALGIGLTSFSALPTRSVI
jgi:chitin disaccharide deacetylase